MATALASTSFLISPAAQPSSGLRANVNVDDDRRCVPRVSRRMRAKLTGHHCMGDVSCETRNVSESGAFVLAPQSCGVCVGQRLEIVFEPEGDRFATSEAGFATVVRTEPAPVGSGTPAVGIGLRFDQPVYF